MSRGKSFRIKKEEVFYYLCSENKGTDKLRSYNAAYLGLCFSHMHKAGFLVTRLKYGFVWLLSESRHKPLLCYVCLYAYFHLYE